MPARMCMQFRCASLRIKKALGIFGPVENWFKEQEEEQQQLEWLFGPAFRVKKFTHLLTPWVLCELPLTYGHSNEYATLTDTWMRISLRNAYACVCLRQQLHAGYIRWFPRDGRSPVAADTLPSSLLGHRLFLTRQGYHRLGKGRHRLSRF